MDVGVDGILFLILESPSECRIEMLELVCADWYFLTSQCQLIVDVMRTSANKREVVDIVALLLPRVVDVDQIQKFVTSNLGTLQVRGRM